MEKFKCQEPTCRNYGRYCRIHLADMETPQQELEKKYPAIKKQFLLTHPVCGVKDCNRPSFDVHHQKGRTGKLLIDIKHFLAVCRAHHNHIEENPIDAKQKGYSKSRLGVSDKRKHLQGKA